MKEIECLKQGQSLNSEMIQSLADAVSGLATALNGLKGNERKNPRISGFVVRKSDTEQSQYANQSIINDSIVLEGLSDSPMRVRVFVLKLKRKLSWQMETMKSIILF